MAKAPFLLFVTLTILYGLAVIYSSLILGPDGLHYIAISPGEAWRKFVAISYVDNASDQRADWIANLMMIIPLSYFLSGALAFQKRSISQKRAAIIAFVACIFFILDVKYAQLFFPPRTVTLNYILAQSIGALVGIVLFRAVRLRIYPKLLDMYENGEGLVIVLGAYTLLVTSYFLMPFDLALTPDDLAGRLSNMPLALIPGAGHDPAYRTFLILADAASTVPVGMFLAITGRDLSARSLMLRGVGLVVPVTILTMFVLSATPFALSLVTRMAGVGVGIWFMSALKGKDLWKRHYSYARYVPAAFAIHVLIVALASGLLTSQWQGLDRAFGGLEPRQLLPLWSLYIVTKAEAAQNFVETFLLFAPIGAMIWLRRGFWSKGAGFSGFLAFTFSLLCEVARLLKPGLAPDFTDPFIAAVGAAMTFTAMPRLWKMFEDEAKQAVQRESHVAAVERVTRLHNVVTLRPLRPTGQTGFHPRSAEQRRRRV
jgi:hypothetical protein